MQDCVAARGHKEGILALAVTWGWGWGRAPGMRCCSLAQPSRSFGGAHAGARLDVGHLPPSPCPAPPQRSCGSTPGQRCALAGFLLSSHCGLGGQARPLGVYLEEGR